MDSSLKIYTKKGDKGETSLIGGNKVSKSHIRIEAYGTIDELNSFVGLLRDKTSNNEINGALLNIQNNLFALESILATHEDANVDFIPELKDKDVKQLEDQIDFMEEKLNPLSNFVIPGGHELNSLAHICRTITRRAERIIVLMQNQFEIQEIIIQYINRLSDYFFVLARYYSQSNKSLEIIWVPNK